MTRPTVIEPQTQEEWYALPKEFVDFLDEIDDYRDKKESDTSGRDYSYTWNVDSTIPLQVAIHYWNKNEPLPNIETIVEDILIGIEEAAYESWSTSFYS